MLRLRRAVLREWRAGRIASGVAVSRLRSMTAVDAVGDRWMMRPSEHGCLFVRIDASGHAAAAPLMSHRPRWTKPLSIAAAVICIGGAAALAAAGWIITG